MFFYTTPYDVLRSTIVEAAENQVLKTYDILIKTTTITPSLNISASIVS